MLYLRGMKSNLCAALLVLICVGGTTATHELDEPLGGPCRWVNSYILDRTPVALGVYGKLIVLCGHTPLCLTSH